MLKVIRSQLYQLVLDKMIFVVLMIWAAMDGYGIYEILYDTKLSGEPSTGGLVFGDWLGTSFPCVMVITGLIMAKDLFDKTLNYELLSGKTRMQVFMGRFVTSLVISEVCVLASIWVFPLTYTAFYGWGENLSVGGALLRTLLVMLFEFRVCAEMALFSVLFRRKATMFFMIPAVMIIPEFAISEFLYLSWEYETISPQLAWLSVFTIYLEPEICNFDSVNVAGTKCLMALPEHSWVHLICTAGIGMLFLLAACRKFSRKDLE